MTGSLRAGRRAARRAAVVLAALLPLAVPVVPAGTALAQSRPEPTRAAEDVVDGAPVQVEVNTLLPRAPTSADQPLQVTGRLVNGGDRAVSGVSVRLLVGGVVDSRSALARADADPVPGRSRGPEREVAEELAPGESVPFDLRLEVGDLGLRRLGVHPVQVQARGLVDGDRRAGPVGMASTFVPWFPEERTRPTRLAFLLPLITAPERAPDGALLGDRTLTEVQDDGRLARLLAAGRTGASGACDLPAAPAPDAAPTPPPAPAAEQPCRGEAVPLTWAVDPDLLETVQALSGEHAVVEGLDPVGPREVRPGHPAAARWLDDLRASVGAAREDGTPSPGRAADVLAVPFADPDVVSVVRSRTGLVNDVEQLRLLGVDTTERVLGTAPLQTVAWPPAGPLTPTGLDAVAATGARAVVLDPQALPPRPPTLSRTPGARTPLTSTVSGRIDGLVVDEALSALLTAGPQDPDWQGDRLAEQRWLVETAIITAERPETRTLLVAPPRRAEVRPAVLSGALLDAGRLPWLCAVPLAAVALHTEACGLEDPEAPPEREEDLGELRAADGEGGLSPMHLQQVAAVRARAEQLTDEVLVAGTEAAAQTRSRLLRSRGRTLSSAWRDDPVAGRTMLALQRAEVDRLRSQVQLVTSGRVLLTSDTGVVEVGLSNALDQPVVVGVALNDPVEARLTSTDTGVQTVGPGQQVQVRVRVEARVSGQFVVRATLLDQAGRPFGEPVELVARSTRYGRLALAVTGVAFGVLLVAVGVRLFRRAVRASAPAELHD